MVIIHHTVYKSQSFFENFKMFVKNNEKIDIFITNISSIKFVKQYPPSQDE